MRYPATAQSRRPPGYHNSLTLPIRHPTHSSVPSSSVVQCSSARVTRIEMRRSARKEERKEKKTKKRKE
ncbi:hypothetical protein VTH06DRAFT_8076 [Thermothelomyces fergusii]